MLIYPAVGTTRYTVIAAATSRMSATATVR
jgi:hypothetical protein